MKRNKPYRVAARTTLTPSPPFTLHMVTLMIERALRGPKKGQVSHSMPSADAIKYLTTTLNARHHFFYCAQQDRARKQRRDHVMKLIDELRAVVPAIAKDADDQLATLKGDFFARNTAVAAQALFDFITGDIPTIALPSVQLPENIFGWQWCGVSLFADVAALIGANAAARFVAEAVPLLTGEKTSAASVASQIKNMKRRVVSQFE